MNNKEKIVKRLLFEIIDKISKDADVYNHNGSLWLINTDSTKWIFEFTKSKTLWYNYNFFRSALKFVSLDINEGDNQKYITEWFESRYLNINQVKHILEVSNPNPPGVEDTIQKGVKHTKKITITMPWLVEETIQEGVKETKLKSGNQTGKVDDTIQNGVKETKGTLRRTLLGVDDIIQNGVKNTWPDKIPNDYDWSEDFEDEIIDVIQEGVKEIQPLPAQDGNMDWGLYYQRQEDRTKPHTEYVRDVIEEHHHRTREVVVTIKDGVKETHQDCSNNIARVEGIIRVGEKLD
jgi:hypothetical protein